MSSLGNVEERAQQLHNILYDSKNKEDDMLVFTLSFSRDEKLKIRQKYEEMFTERPLLDDFNKKLSGDFRDLMTKLYMGRAELDANQLIRSFKFLYRDYATVYEIVFTRPSWLKEQIKQIYEHETGKPLEKDLQDFAPSAVKKTLIDIFNTDRKENKDSDHDKCQQLAAKLYGERVENWVSNEEIMRDIFTNASPEELVLITRYYLRKTGTTILEAVDRLPSAQKKFFDALLYNVINPPELFAKRINEAIKGLGTDTNLLERIIVTRYDIDMFIIKKYYYQFYNATIKDDIIGDTKGDYQKLLLALINLQSQEDN